MDIDGKTVWTLSRSAPTLPATTCAAGGWVSSPDAFFTGGNVTDLKCFQMVDVTVPHTNSTMTLEVYSYLGATVDDESYLFDSVRVTLR